MLTKLKIVIIGTLEHFLFIREFQKMVSLMIFIVSGILKIFLGLRLRIIAVSHHKIPVDLFFDNILRHGKIIMAGSDEFDDVGINARLLLHLAKSGLVKILALFNGTLGKHPAFIFVLVVFV